MRPLCPVLGQLMRWDLAPGTGLSTGEGHVGTRHPPGHGQVPWVPCPTGATASGCTKAGTHYARTHGDSPHMGTAPAWLKDEKALLINTQTMYRGETSPHSPAAQRPPGSGIPASWPRLAGHSLSPRGGPTAGPPGTHRSHTFHCKFVPVPPAQRGHRGATAPGRGPGGSGRAGTSLRCPRAPSQEGASPPELSSWAAGAG